MTVAVCFRHVICLCIIIYFNSSTEFDVSKLIIYRNLVSCNSFSVFSNFSCSAWYLLSIVSLFCSFCFSDVSSSFSRVSCWLHLLSRLFFSALRTFISSLSLLLSALYMLISFSFSLNRFSISFLSLRFCSSLSFDRINSKSLFSFLRCSFSLSNFRFFSIRHFWFWKSHHENMPI